MLDWDFDNLCRLYKDIRLSCFEKGYLMPILINEVSEFIPDEYDFSNEEWVKIINNFDGFSEDEVYRSLVEKRNLFMDLMLEESSFIDFFDGAEEILEEEVFDFLEEFPEFNEILL